MYCSKTSMTVSTSNKLKTWKYSSQSVKDVINYSKPMTYHSEHSLPGMNINFKNNHAYMSSYCQLTLDNNLYFSVYQCKLCESIKEITTTGFDFMLNCNPNCICGQPLYSISYMTPVNLLAIWNEQLL